ncbi:hypothetical protein GCM10025880_09870 [Methylorubrum aminovorans]|nr:hypothetical protein GCM10025880_09870 [Methylorubrum aminovorans]
MAEALSRIGYAGSDAVPVPDAFLELHIEGGPVLEREGLHFGAFTRFWGATKYRLAFLGRQAHTGPTPMAERRDALLGAAYLIADLKAMTADYGLDLHTSVGRLEVRPNSPNTVPSEAVLFIELRSGSPAILEEAELRLKAAIDFAAARAEVGYEVRSIDRRSAGPMAPGLVRLAERAAAAKGTTTRHLDTIGGHDAVSLSAVCPAVVLAVPCRGGVMHHPTEFASPEDQAFGTQLLADMLMILVVEGVAAIETGGGAMKALGVPEDASERLAEVALAQAFSARPELRGKAPHYAVAVPGLASPSYHGVESATYRVAEGRDAEPSLFLKVSEPCAAALLDPAAAFRAAQKIAALGLAPEPLHFAEREGAILFRCLGPDWRPATLDTLQQPDSMATVIDAFRRIGAGEAFGRPWSVFEAIRHLRALLGEGATPCRPMRGSCSTGPRRSRRHLLPPAPTPARRMPTRTPPTCCSAPAAPCSSSISTWPATPTPTTSSAPSSTRPAPSRRR